jgi:hypothetical protein
MGVLLFKGGVGVGMLKWQTSVSPLDKGGEGREWGDSARAGICELWFGDWYYPQFSARAPVSCKNAPQMW